MIFKRLALSQIILDLIGEKVGLKIEDEDTLCWAIEKLLYLHGREENNMILTREKRLNISKRLAALCIIAVHDQGIDHDCCDKIIEHTAEIAYSIGGVNMMNLVQKLEHEMYVKAIKPD